MLPDSPDVEGVSTGDEGLLASAKPGAIWVDASTIRPDVAIRLAQAASAKGIRAVDAPVSGATLRQYRAFAFAAPDIAANNRLTPGVVFSEQPFTGSP